MTEPARSSFSSERTALSVARQSHYYEIMRTTAYVFTAIAAIDALGPDGYSAPLTALVVLITAYGILAGNVALEDIENLRRDISDELAQTHYGKGVQHRNVPMLKALSAALVALVAAAELYALWI